MESSPNHLWTRLVRSLREVHQELGKVIWPKRKELITYSLVVLVTVAVLCSFVYVLDQLFARFVVDLFGR